MSEPFYYELIFKSTLILTENPLKQSLISLRIEMFTLLTQKRGYELKLDKLKKGRLFL